MANEAKRLVVPPVSDAVRSILMNLARDASVELNVQDVSHLQESRRLLVEGSRVYVSHLPKQTFEDTVATCAAVKAAGLDAIPHVPVRLLESHEQLSQFVAETTALGVRELLLISGDYANAIGPFSTVADLLRSTDLRALGIERLSIGGHPEGHTKVALEEIRRAELEKDRLAAGLGICTTIVTQFFFESAPFLQWAAELRAAGATANIRAGLAGPAKITTLLRYAARCGVGSSIKALGSRPGAFAKLLGEHGPEQLLTQLAAEMATDRRLVQGIHLFCFGGYLRTCRWLHQIANGAFTVSPAGDLEIA